MIKNACLYCQRVLSASNMTDFCNKKCESKALFEEVEQDE
jgi:hypothetical protein